jgi:hypothetical protein
MSSKNKPHLLKKIQAIRAELQQLDHPAETGIKRPDRLDEIQIREEGLHRPLDWFKKDVTEKDKEYLQLLQLLADVCVGMWRTHSKMIDPNSGEALEETRRALRPLESTMDILRQGGFEIKDHSNKPYVVGMLENVVAWETKEGLKSEMIIETIRPTIIYQEMVLKQGEIIVGVPPKA